MHDLDDGIRVKDLIDPAEAQTQNPETHGDLQEINRQLDLQVRMLVQRRCAAEALVSRPSLSQYPLERRQQALASAVSAILAEKGEDVEPEDIVIRAIRPDLKAKGLGDLTIDVPTLKENKTGAEKGVAINRFRTEIIPLLMVELPKRLSFPMRISQAGIFLNVTLDHAQFHSEILKLSEDMGDQFGSSDVFKGKSVVLDYSSPNMGKPMHVGHLRTTVIGQVLSNLLNETGAIVYAVNHIGDWGTIFGHLTTAYKLWGKEVAEEIDPDKDPMGFLSALYVKIRKGIKAEKGSDGEAQSELENLGRRNFALLEANDPEVVALWQKINQWSMVELDRVYKRLGISFDIFLGESFYTDGMPEMVEAAKASGLVEFGLDGKSLVLEFGEKHGSDPAGPTLAELKKQILQLNSQLAELRSDEEGNTQAIKDIETQIKHLDQQANQRRVLPLCMILKADGGSVYLTRDVAAIRYRRRHFRADKIIYVIGSEQKMHMSQVYETARRIGDINGGECTHVSFGLIKKPDGSKVSSREGAGGLMGLLDELREAALALVDTAEKRAYITPEQMEEIAERIAKGALIYSNFAQDRERDMVFDPAKMLSLHNQTGPYLQYSVMRLGSLLDKLGGTQSDTIIDTEIFATIDVRAIELIEMIGNSPQIIAESASKNAPHLLATYLYDLASSFNKFYTASVKDVGRLTALQGEKKAVYTKIIAASHRVLRKGLKLLNIEVPSKM